MSRLWRCPLAGGRFSATLAAMKTHRLTPRTATRARPSGARIFRCRSPPGRSSFLLSLPFPAFVTLNSPATSSVRILSVFLLAAAAAFGATPPAPPTVTPEIAKLRSEIEKILHDNHTPGAAIAIVRRSGPEWVDGVGMADVANRTPVTPDTLFRIGSTSKAFVSLSLLKLQREGKISLNDTLASRAPDLAFANRWEAANPVRLVHLVEHTTGWDDMAMCEYGYDAPDSMTLRDALAVHPSTRTSRWKPGTRFSYSNEGPPVAAYVVERVTGQKFEDYVIENWFKPLGMTTATYYEPAPATPFTHLYRKDGITPFPYWHILLRPAGSINASARDMANYVQFYLNRGSVHGKQLLPEEDIVRAETSTTTLGAAEGLHNGYGLGNYTSILGGWIYHGHNGGVRGGLTEMAYLPDVGVGYAVMINTDKGVALAQICRAVQRYITAGEAKPIEARATPYDRTLARQYDGFYEAVSPRIEFLHAVTRLYSLARVRAEADGLRVIRYTPKKIDRRYFYTGGRLFAVAGEPKPTLALISDRSDGKLIEFALGGTYRRVSAALIIAQFAAIAAVLLLGAGTLVFAIVWGIRLAAGKLANAPALHVRVVPLAATVGAVGLVAIAMVAANEPFVRFGHITAWSLALCALTVIVPTLGVFGIVRAWQCRSVGIHPLVWWHSFLTSVAIVLAATYFAYYGLIPWLPWA